jgi:transposase InsO family protein
MRLKPERKNHVWSYDFMNDRTENGKVFRILNIIDEHEKECLSITSGRKITAYDVIHVLADLFISRGVPEHIRSDNGPEFTAKEVRKWLESLGVKTLFIEPGSPWQNGYIESFNGKLRNELLNREVFGSMYEAQVLLEQWRKEYNHIRPHHSLGGRPPVPLKTIPQGYLGLTQWVVQ